MVDHLSARQHNFTIRRDPGYDLRNIPEVGEETVEANGSRLAVGHRRTRAGTPKRRLSVVMREKGPHDIQPFSVVEHRATVRGAVDDFQLDGGSDFLVSAH